LESGTLRLSLLRPIFTTKAIIRNVNKYPSQDGCWALRTTPVSEIRNAQKKLKQASFYIRKEQQFEGQQERTCDVERILIDDTEYEI
jgi:hypothetical protein